MKKIILSILLVMMFSIPVYAEVYWVDEQPQNSSKNSGPFYAPFGYAPMTWMPEFSSPIWGPTLSSPYQYPMNLYYQQQFYNFYPYFYGYPVRNSRNRNWHNYLMNPYYWNYHQYWYGDQWNYRRQNNGSRNCPPGWNNDNRNCPSGWNESNRNCYQNQENNQGNKASNNPNFGQNRNCYGMPPYWYEPFVYGPPKNWDYYKQIYEQWSQNRNLNEQEEKQNPSMQDKDYQKWLEETGNWYKKQGKEDENEEKVAGDSEKNGEEVTDSKEKK